MHGINLTVARKLEMFFGKKIVLKFLEQKALKWALNEVAQVLRKISAWNYFDFLFEVTVVWQLKIDCNNCLWKIHVLEFWEEAQNEF